LTSPITAVLHVEVVHDRPEDAAAFLERTLGAERVEPRLAEYLSSLHPDLHVVHVRFGNLVVQIVKPPDTERLASWHEQLSREGPGIHDIAIMVDDLDEVRDRMVADGATERHAFDGMTLGKSGMAVDGVQRAFLIDARTQAGIRFELIENIPAWVPGEAP
jgi:catechol 2,3-dioxygenase-like lactoylglutathione lyase family enzyme